MVQPKYLNFEITDSPALSLLQSQNELSRMSTYVEDSLTKVKEDAIDNKKAGEIYKNTRKNEKILNNYRNNMNKFLLGISEKELSEDDALEVVNHMAIAHCLDRMGYFSRKLSGVYRHMDEDKIKMSDEASVKVKQIIDANVEFYKESMAMLKETDDAKIKSFARDIPRKASRIKAMIKEAKFSHFERVKRGICPPGAGIYYVDLLNILSNMQYQTRNLAEAVVGSELTEEDIEAMNGNDIMGTVIKTVKKSAKKTKHLIKKPINKLRGKKSKK